MKRKLNLGCGGEYKKGWVNLDISHKVYGVPIKVDVEWDLNKFPYPFEDSQFNEVLIKLVLGYLDNPIKVLKELTRISKNKAKIVIYESHAKAYCSLTQLDYKNHFTENTFNNGHLKQYGLKELELIEKEILWNEHEWKRYIPFKKYLKIFIGGLYDCVKFELKVTKSKQIQKEVEFI